MLGKHKYTAEQRVPDRSAFEFAIEKIRSHKSPDIDQIPSELIKIRGRTIRYEIHNLTTSIRNKEELPKEWKGSIILPVCKKGDCSNDRGISLLVNTYQILSTILLLRLTLYVEEIIRDHHFGFRRNRSTTDHKFCIRQILEKNCE